MKEISIVSSRKRRIAAFFIDFVFFSSIIVLISFSLIGNDLAKESNPEDFQKKILYLVISGLLLFFTKDSFRGISLGRWILGIMVRNRYDPNTAPSLFQLFFRNLFLIIWPIEFLVMLGNDKKERIGDKVSNTLVFRNYSRSRRAPRIFALFLLGIVFFVFFILFIGNTIKNSEAYQTAIDGIDKNKELIEITGGIKSFGMIPMGSISISDSIGKAVLEIKVFGEKERATVTVYMYKESNEPWVILKTDIE